MSKKLVLMALATALCLLSTGRAATIIWVSDNYDELADGVPDDAGFVELLESTGHTIDNTPGSAFGNGYWRTLDADKIATLNAADLIVYSRSSDSGNYDDDDEINQWNSITTPMILMSPYQARSSRWLWVDNTSLTGDGGTPLIEAVDPSHPLFYEIELNASNQVEIYDQSVGTGTVSFYGSLDVGNGELIAQVAGQDLTAIAEWEAGVEYHAGAGQTPGSDRLMLFMGTREGVGYGRGEYNLNEQGAKLFINAVQYMLGELQRLKASSPNPKDGTIHADTWANLGWTAGDTAVSHDFYFGTSFDDVNDGAEGTFQSNLTDTFAVVGFPGFPIPEGLAAGTTYYWRIDEVEADGNVQKGDTWSFLVPPKEAYNPVPADGAKFIDTNTDLTWTTGWGGKLHTVYFGDNFDDVNNAAGGSPQQPATFDPGQLEISKVYYWRVDEFDGVATVKGRVWSFTTVTPGGGVRGQYYRSVDLTGLPALNQVDPEIDFDWADDTPDPALQNDSFSVRWAGELEVAFSEPYTFYANTDDGVRLWVDDELIINRWVDRRSATEAKGTIDLVGGQRYSLVMEYYDSGGTAVAQLSWESPTLAKQIIPQAALSLPVRASGPNPRNGATGARTMPILTWNAGDNAASHEVYFGTDADAVLNATKASPEFVGAKALGEESYDPGKLAWDTAYYWRVDEVNSVHPDSPWVGGVWSFTTGDFLVIDDFETYTDNDGANEAIWQSWIDGYGVATNGSQVGYVMPPYAELTIYHGGRQSMPFSYDNTAGATDSQAELALTTARDWTEEGVAELSIWFRGNPASVGSFTEGPVGTYTMTGAGADIWNQADEFHFAYKTLNGAGTITARVESVENTNDWAKAGVMIRETLDAGSKFAAVYIMPSTAAGEPTNGCRFQARTDTDVAATSDTSVATPEQMAITAPYWIKLERDVAGNFRGSYSADGANWESLVWRPNISMDATVYVGLALTSHDAGATCEAVFSNVTTTGSVTGQWASQDVGIASNAAEPLYVAVSNATGAPAIVVHDDPAAATIDTWTEWVVPLQAFADKGIDLTDVDSIAIGLGSGSGVASGGGSGRMFFDDIRLYRPR
ncbi:MAG: PA14 domain-containing protein [Planctomycetota bacterium]|jgi:hypothetical protein